jgi:hypothetical protein
MQASKSSLKHFTAVGKLSAYTGAQITSDRARGRSVAGRDAGLELRPLIGWDLHGEIAHPVRQSV